MTKPHDSQKSNFEGKLSNSSVESIYNNEIKIPADIKKSIEIRQRESIKNEKTIQQYYESLVFTPAEMIARNKIFERIAKKIEIYEEIVELHEIEKMRSVRCLKAFKKVQSNQLLKNLL